MTAFAQEAGLDAAPPAQEQPVEAPVAPPPAPPPYSLPWQLRPVASATVLRSDTSFGFYKPKGATGGGSAIASMLLGSYKLSDSFAPMIRLGVLSHSPAEPPAPALDSAFVFLNPVVGGTYVLKLSPELKLGLFLGLAIPIGSGAGDKPDPEIAPALNAGRFARSAMDNAMFAVNDFTVFPGVGLSFVKSGFTVQGELTLLQLFRVKGDGGGNPAAVPPVPTPNPDSSKTNLTLGLHLGYFFIPQLSAGLELRHQRWLSTPAAVKADEAGPKIGVRDTTTVALGLRAHFKLSDTMWIRPGISYSRGLDDPMSVNDYNIVQLDIPVVF